MISKIPVTPLYRTFISWIYNWDGRLFQTIASEGYRYPLQVFFPAWPLLIRSVTATGVDPVFGTHIILTALQILVFFVFFALAERLFGTVHAKRGLALFAVFPPTMIMLAGYSESLYLLLVLSAAYFALRENTPGTVFAAAVSTATRITGITSVFLVFSLKKPVVTKLLLCLAAISGLVVYMTYLYVSSGDPILFLHGHREWCASRGTCGRSLISEPLSNIISETFTYRNNFTVITSNFHAVDLAYTALAILMLVPVFFRLGIWYFMYSAANIVMLLATGNTSSMTRYVIAVFPIFLVLPFFMRNRWVYRVTLTGMFLLQLEYINYFSSGGFIG